MMTREEGAERIDPALAARVAGLSPGGQRWLKTAIQAIRTLTEDEPGREPAPRPAQRRAAPEQVPPPGLEDVITGKAKLEDLESYPELAEELEGLGEIIDMLRGLGEARRKRGEEILREEILGQPPEEQERRGRRPRKPEPDEEDFSF
jgi:hypothetical protein